MECDGWSAVCRVVVMVMARMVRHAGAVAVIEWHVCRDGDSGDCWWSLENDLAMT